MPGDDKRTIQSYDDTVDEYIRKTENLHPTKDAKTFLSLLKKGDSLLDLGCGPGRDARIFVDRGYQVTGIDLSQNMIEVARKRVPEADFRIMDIRTLDFADDFFDGVWACASLIHISKKELPEVLRNVKRILKPGGVFFLLMKQGNTEGLITDNRYNGVSKFLNLVEEQEIAALLVQAGFRIISTNVSREINTYVKQPSISIMCNS